MRITTLIVMATVTVAAAATTGRGDSSQELKDRLTSLVLEHEGDVSVSIRHLDGDFEFHLRPDEPMPTASLIKLPVMVETYRQSEAEMINLNTMVTLKESDKVPGSGILRPHFSPGSQLRLKDCVRLMITYSDNTATNLVIHQIGIRSTADSMQQLGLPETKLHSMVYRGNTSVFPERSRRFGLGSTTSREMIQLLQKLHEEAVVSPEACREMRGHLRTCENRDCILRFLPPQVEFAHKTGAVAAARCDAGLLKTEQGTVAICVLTANNKDRSWGDGNGAEILCGRIGEAVYHHFSPHGPSGAPKEQLQIGDFGEQVETLQRTLNARLTPSPELSVDGDFGPATQEAVRQFQAAYQQPVTGVIDSAAWKALSPLLTTATEVLAPEVANAEGLPTQPGDELTGPPFVTCDAWCIADAESGQVLWNHNGEQKLPMASTTKMMTAYVVLQLAEQNPSILDETIRFSRRADRTRGSTSGIKEGESLPVRELLYGLLLPSGNDASVALAEHFGSRYRKANDDDSQSVDSLSTFVEQMNATASQLGMKRTSYRNPHGLDTAEHFSSASDLCILAKAALDSDVFRHYVSTRQRGCTVTGPGGYTRNIVWKNTNRLLPIEGYDGIKTGTTSRAGACLVSMGQRDDRRLIIAVLGSASSTGRYVDTRNLFRFAWQSLDDR